MKKEKRVLLILILIVFTIVIGFFATHYFIKIHLTNAAVAYLCEKYDATETEFELVDYERSKYFLNDDAIPQLEKGNYRWEFRYQGRNFYVNKIDEKYCDDYQLEDVEKWCVKWLQENIDESVVFVDISFSNLYAYQLNVPNENTLLSYALINDFFIKNYAFLWDATELPIGIYYINSSINDNYLHDKSKNKLNDACYFQSINRLKYEIKYYKEEMCWGKSYEYIREKLPY